MQAKFTKTKNGGNLIIEINSEIGFIGKIQGIKW